MAELNDAGNAADQAETFDETHIDDEGEGDILLDEINAVPDLTQKVGDGSEDDLSLEEELDASGVDPSSESPTDQDVTRKSELDAESDAQSGSDEVELVYSGLMRNQKGAQASAAHWESRRLADDDIDSLGYGTDTDDEAKT